MMALIAAVFVASLLGSMHCAGMCGAFLAFAVAGGDSAGSTRGLLHLAYNGGRLITYTLLGAIAGALGSAVDLGGSALGLQRTAAAVAGALMVGFGLLTILRLAGVRIGRVPLPRALQELVTRGHRLAFSWPPLARALVVGLLTTLLPCGWLYAFAITAAGTADPIKGAVTMAVFWAGTLPIMLSLGIGLQALTGPLRQRLPVLTSLLVVAVGLATLFGRFSLPVSAAVGESGPDSMNHLVNRVNSLDSSEMPCCNDR
jgi:sulfite exporter TauE/SafE